MNLGFQIFKDNQKKYLTVLKEQGFRRGSREHARFVLNECERFLMERNLSSTDDIFNTSVINKFISWKIIKRRRKQYHPLYRYKVRRQLVLFLEWFSIRSKRKIYKRNELDQIIEEYIKSTSWPHPRWPIDIRNKLDQFFNYTDKRRISSLNKLSDRILDQFISETETRFYKARKKYCNNNQSYLKATLKKYFQYLDSQQLVAFEDPSTREDEAILLKPVISRYLDFCKDTRGLKPNTLNSIRRILYRFSGHLEHLKIEKLLCLKIAHIDSFVSAWYKGSTFETILSIHAVLRRFLKFIYIEKYMIKDLSGLIISPRVYSQAHIPDFLSKDELLRLFQEKPEPIDNTEVRALAIVRLLLFTGMRAGEAASLHLDDIDWDKKQIVLRNRKNAQDLLVILPDQAIEALYHYILKVRPNKRPERNVFFTTFAPIIPMDNRALVCAVLRFFKSSGVRGGAHRCRHTFAQHLLESGSSIGQIQTLLGHKEQNSTRIYAKTSMTRMRQYVVGSDD